MCRLQRKGMELDMARKNRISLPDAVYHVTARIAHRAMLFAADGVKDRIMQIIYGTAFFSGVEVYACCVMDNHLHILVHVPTVPERLWTEAGREPDSYAFGMRPPECRRPMWPRPQKVTAPRPRPAAGFTLDDDEFVERLAGICGREAAERRVDGWRRLEERGCGARAAEERERLCRRMYNLSQFMKTLKERVTRVFNTPRGRGGLGHEGALWQGRFHSGVVEPSSAALSAVAAYVEYNPVRAGLADAPGGWRWSSFSCALGDGPLSATCRRMYGKMLQVPRLGDSSPLREQRPCSSASLWYIMGTVPVYIRFRRQCSEGVACRAFRRQEGLLQHGRAGTFKRTSHGRELGRIRRRRFKTRLAVDRIRRNGQRRVDTLRFLTFRLDTWFYSA